MKKTLLDTDITSFLLRNDQSVLQNTRIYLSQYPQLTLSSITYYEILRGLRYKNATTQIRKFQEFASKCEILPIDMDTLDASATIYAQIRKSGTPIGDNDLLIAGVAIVHDLVLSTNNTKHFGSIAGLKLVNWKTQ